MLDIVISNKCKKDLRRAKKWGLDLNDFFAVVEKENVKEYKGTGPFVLDKYEQDQSAELAVISRLIIFIICMQKLIYTVRESLWKSFSDF